jgi:oligopeptide/dipeptide ABC transporter ATP-binding protein
MSPVLEIRNLEIRYDTATGSAHAVDGISFNIEPGEYLGLVGESGCGKSTVAKAILGILPPNGKISAGDIFFQGTALNRLSPADLRTIRWQKIALIPQSAMDGFDPVYTVRRQLEEAITSHVKMPPAERRKRLEEVFELVGIATGRLDAYPHQFSGGMRQRAMIAMAMILDPVLVVADEPTTGLDVIVQDQILQRIRDIHERMQKTMLLITHDMAVVAENCDKIAVMYAGRIMEYGPNAVFEEPFHPYTMGLRNAFPDLDDRDRELISIPGGPPSLLAPPRGCRFHERCPFATARCAREEPALTPVGENHVAACHYVEKATEFRKRAADPDTWRRAAIAEPA